MVVKNKGIYKERLKVWIFPCCVSIYLHLFSLLFSNSVNIYILLNDALCSAVASSLGLICFLKRELKYGAFYKNIGSCFFLISLVSYVHIYINKKYILNTDSFYISDNLTKVTYYMEHLVILVSYILEDVNNKVRYELLLIMKLLLGGMAVIIIFIISETISNFDTMTRYVLGLVMILDLAILYCNKINLKKRERKMLYLYIFLISVYQYIRSNYGQFGDNGVIISLSIRLLSYYVIFLSISKCVMKESYESMKEELENIHIAEKDINNILKNRNRTLMQLEYMIEKSSENYAHLIEQISDGIVIFYYNKVYYINSEAKKILEIGESTKKYNFNEFCERVLRKNKIIEKVDFVVKSLEEVALLKREDFKFNLLNYSGTQYEIYFFNIDSISRLVYIKDVTEANRNYEFKRKYKEYLKGEELKNEFYSNISHELRTPINLIYSALQLSEMNLNDEKICNLEKHNETIKHNCLRLIRTINNFIYANKISEGYLNADFKIYNIVSIVENISLACNVYMEKIQNRLIFDSTEEELYVKCDKEMIERIILNILSNSVKFGKNGGMTTVNIREEDRVVIIQIKNNGYIVNDEEKPYIFDKFTKVNKSLNRSSEGSGLGLFLSKALVELNNGMIILESNKQIGTEFTIKFPLYTGSSDIECDENYDVIDRLKEKVDIEFSDIYI